MQRLLVLLIGLVAYGSADNCGWGESYWCSSLQNAKECRAFDHCKTTIWKNQILKEDQSEVCQFCETIVQDVHGFILENKTEQEIVRFLSNVCQMIPQQSAAAECQGLVDTFAPEIIQLVASQLDAQMICSFLKLCQGLEDNVMHSNAIQSLSPSKPSSPDYKMLHPLSATTDQICTDCMKFFQDIDNFITGNATQDEVEQLIDQNLCSLLGTLEEQCKTLVHSLLPQIMDMLKGYLNATEVCQAMGFCKQMLPDINTFFIRMKLKATEFYKKAHQSSTEECTLCKTILTEIVALDRDQTVQSEIKDFLKTEVCKQFADYATMCNSLVDTYAPELFQLLATELDPESRCRSLGFCAASNKIGDPVRDSMPNREPASKTALHVSSSAECVLCEYIMKELQSLIGNNATEAQIVAALEKVCSILPSSLQASCNDFINAYGKLIIQLLLAEMDPQAICTTIGLCTNSSIVIPIAVPNDVRCTVCETIVQYVEALLEENATIAEIKSYLNKICNFLPETIRPECNFIVQFYEPYIIQYISTDLSPKEVCSLSGVCIAAKREVDDSTPNKEPASKTALHVLPSDECDVCKYIILEILIISNASEPQIVAALEKVCYIVPSSLQASCNNYISAYGKLIIELLLAGLDPQAVCSTIGLCPNSSIVMPNAVPIEKIIPVKAVKVGENECTWGPSYWCRSREIAARCKATDYCEDKGWLF